VLCALCATASVASATSAAGRRPPPGGLEFQGVFHRALWGGGITFQLSDDGRAVLRVQGILPGTCRDRSDGRLKRTGPDGAIGLLFDVGSRAGRIALNGSFGFTARNALGEGLDPAKLTISGTFYGNNVLGRVKGRGGTGRRYSNCRGDEPFWAKRTA
jgi:hypothetical protein